MELKKMESKEEYEKWLFEIFESMRETLILCTKETVTGLSEKRLVARKKSMEILIEVISSLIGPIN